MASGGRWFLAVALFGAAERLALSAIYAPATYGDTPSYLRLAEALAGSGLGGYDGTRVPGYPAFLAVLGQDPAAIWRAQLALGWAASLLLFVMGWKSTGSPRLGAAAAMAYNLTAGLVLFESNLLSETLTTFLVVLALALLLALDRQVAAGAGIGRGSKAGEGIPARELEAVRGRPPAEWALAAAVGIAAGLAGLTRPLFYLLAPVLTPFVWFAGGLLQPLGNSSPGGDGPGRRLARLAAFARAGTGPRLARLAAFALPAGLLLGGWIAWVFRTYEMLSPTTMSGYHLVQHTGEYFEYLPDEQAAIRDTYLKYRDAQIAARGTQTNAIWDAIPELSQVSGLSFFGLSAELQRLSVQLIRQHPLLYLRNVAQGWIDFWKAPVYWDPEGLRLAGLRSAFVGWGLLGRGLSIAANAVFLLASAALAVSRRVRERLGLDGFSLALGGTVWAASIAQTLADHGDNPRFLVPLQAVVMLTVLRAAWFWRRRSSPETHL